MIFELEFIKYKRQDIPVAKFPHGEISGGEIFGHDFKHDTKDKNNLQEQSLAWVGGADVDRYYNGSLRIQTYQVLLTGLEEWASHQAGHQASRHQPAEHLVIVVLRAHLAR